MALLICIRILCCSADNGGAFWIYSGSAVTVSNLSSSTFDGNFARYASGGVFILTGGIHTIANNMFLGNSAANLGGAIFFLAICGDEPNNGSIFGESERQDLFALSSYSLP